MMLHPIKGYNSYCGPAALSSLLGITTDEAAKEIRAFSGQQMVKGSHAVDLLKVLRVHGWSSVQMPPYVKTVRFLDREFKHYEKGLYLCSTSYHHLVLRREAYITCAWFYVDSLRHTPTALKNSGSYNHRIDTLYYLVPPPSTTATDETTK